MNKKSTYLDEVTARKALLYAYSQKQPIFDLFPDICIGISGGSVVRDIYKFLHKEDFSCKDSKFQDIDIYVDKNQRKNIRECLLENNEVLLKGHIYEKDTKYFYRGNRLDIIFVDTDKITVREVIKKFDMIHCSVILTKYVCNFNIIKSHVEVLRSSLPWGDSGVSTMNSIYRKEIIFNCIKSPSSTMYRVSKYSRRGFFLGKEQAELFTTMIDKLKVLRDKKTEEILSKNNAIPEKKDTIDYEKLDKCSDSYSSSCLDGVEVKSNISFMSKSYGFDDVELKSTSKKTNNVYRFIDI